MGRLTLQGMFIILGCDIWEMEKRLASWKYFIDIQKCELLRSLDREETNFPLLLKLCLPEILYKCESWTFPVIPSFHTQMRRDIVVSWHC